MLPAYHLQLNWALYFAKERFKTVDLINNGEEINCNQIGKNYSNSFFSKRVVLKLHNLFFLKIKSDKKNMPTDFY